MDRDRRPCASSSVVVAILHHQLPASPRPALPLSCSPQPSPAQPCPLLFHSISPCLTCLPFPVLSCLAMPCPNLSYPTNPFSSFSSSDLHPPLPYKSQFISLSSLPVPSLYSLSPRPPPFCPVLSYLTFPFHPNPPSNHPTPHPILFHYIH